MRMLNNAVELARANPTITLPRLGAILTNGRRTFFGINSHKTHPLQWKYNSWGCLHAEMAAIVNAKQNDLSDYTLFVARVLKDGSPALAKPCKHCQRAIADFKIKRVVHT